MFGGVVMAYRERESWYIVYTRVHWEKHVAASLEQRGMEVFLPLVERWKRVGRHERAKVRLPLFPRYLFVRCHLTHPTWRSIVKTLGVVRMLGYDDGPAPVPDEQIESVRRIIETRWDVEGHPYLKEGDKVIVVRGPLRGVVGTLVEVARNRHKLVISVDIMERAVAVTINASDVEKYWEW
ncbi:MAG TPA: UpxY family transcription antiterminator [Armatimonadetes bacterium]|nr:UpxY family transcription antiterminator [Armatimonadota bacterium]